MTDGPEIEKGKCAGCGTVRQVCGRFNVNAAQMVRRHYRYDLPDRPLCTGSHKAPLTALNYRGEPIVIPEPPPPPDLRSDAEIRFSLLEFEQIGGTMTDNDKSLPCLILMVGLPRSGKTTLARQLGFPIVSPDEIRLALHGQVYVSSAEPFVWAIAKTMVRALFGAGHGTVILDGCNNTVARRDEWKSSSWHSRLLNVATPVSDCRDRAIAAGRDDILPVIDRMAAAHEPPTFDEIRWRR